MRFLPFFERKGRGLSDKKLRLCQRLCVKVGGVMVSSHWLVCGRFTAGIVFSFRFVL